MIGINLWNVDSTKILLRSELTAVLGDLAKQSRYSARVRLDRSIFRLACCCGLRVSEIAQLVLDDVRLDSLRPHLRIRAAIAKCGRARRVPLWWDAGTLEDLAVWKAERERAGAGADDLLIRSCRGAMSRHTYAVGSSGHARRLGHGGFARSRFTMGGTRSFRMRSPADGRLRRFATPQGIRACW